jgi:hypothetical protein
MVAHQRSDIHDGYHPPKSRPVLADFQPPAKASDAFEHLFVTAAHYKIQTLAESHEYKKISGSSDAAMTYDTTAV